MNDEELAFWKGIYLAAIAGAVDSGRNMYLLNQFAREVADRAVDDLREAKGVNTGI